MKTQPKIKSRGGLFLALSFALVLLAGGAGRAAAEMKVVTLHPMITDLARQVGGDDVQVTGLMKPGDDPHHFEPNSEGMSQIHSARLVLASGKGLEPYLSKLNDSLGTGGEIVEVGRLVPSIKIEADAVFVCCPAHSAGALDPHWWHSIKNMERAAGIVADEFAKADPSHAGAYAARAKAYKSRLSDLYIWAKKEISRIPRNDRELATSHAAFGYFCKEFGFKSVPVQGLGRESEVSSQYLEETANAIRKYEIKAVFPERLANPKPLETVTRTTGVRVAEPLIADGSAAGVETYEAFMRHNVSVIVDALAGS